MAFRSPGQFLIAAVAGLGAGAIIVLEVSRFLSDPSISLLIPEGGADWIRFSEPLRPAPRAAGSEENPLPEEVVTNFRKRFNVDQVPNSAVLTIRAMKLVMVFLDGQLILGPDAEIDRWKIPRQVDLGSGLLPGTHELGIKVLNRNGPAALLAYSKSLNLHTGSDWEASQNMKVWTPALPVDRRVPPLFSGRFPSAGHAFSSALPFLLPVFIAVFLWTFGSCSRHRWLFWLRRLTPSAGIIRWGLLVAWGLLALNNFGKVPTDVGFDTDDHSKYIRYVAENKRIPLATEGFEMGQPPLYYIISGSFYLFLRPLVTSETGLRILRLFPILCGAAQVEICYRMLRRVYRDRTDLQALGTIIGGMLPLNLYISQGLGNEPLEGVLSSAVLVMLFGFLHAPPEANARRRLLLLGALLGLALLAKMTAILLIPVLVFLLAYSFSRKGQPLARVLSDIGVVLGAAFLISGWYYLRNWIELGSPFVGNWDPSSHMVWWQDPGYRTPRDFLTFGRSLANPVYASVYGFWDGFYSTLWTDGLLSGLSHSQRTLSWNYDLMPAGAWLALLPSAGILLGVIAALRRPAWSLQRGELFAVVCLAIYLGALMHFYLKVPVYGTGQARYTLGILPCYAVLASGGLDLLIHRPLLRASVYGAVACWALSSYLTYFVY